jgi:ketosteroid isomerase-like protein
MAVLESLDREIRGWLESFATAVRARRYDRGRRLFDQQVMGFGTRAARVDGLDALEARQWREIWETTRDFRFDLESARFESVDGQAWVGALWSSTGLLPCGGTFPRSGRATIVLVRRPEGWRAVHTHFSLDPREP